MKNLKLIIVFCLLIQGCSNTGGGLKPDAATTTGKNAQQKEPEKNGLLAITQFMAVMSVLKTQVD